MAVTVGANHYGECCGREPVLRVRPRLVLSAEIPYVTYECAVCRRSGGLAITEAEARCMWENGGVIPAFVG